MNQPMPVTRTDHVAVVTLASDTGRPVLDRRAYRRLTRRLVEAAHDTDVHVVVLRGAPGSFCLGGDLAEFLDPAGHGTLIEAVFDLFHALATFPKPIIACVEGDAVGVGCTILFHCDLVIASPDSNFRVPFVDFGLVPDAATSILAPERLGYPGAFRFFCLGETLSAEAAQQLGLVGEVVPGGAEARCLELARRLARKPVEALARTRRLFRREPDELCERIREEIELFQRALEDSRTLRRLRRLARHAA